MVTRTRVPMKVLLVRSNADTLVQLEGDGPRCDGRDDDGITVDG